mmetsp:Transcript_27498/g.65150  ORF Transcript_27498/g.65150 Transcript_27498/m.65150 type:complete len:205 (-) Transcript_27498:689-1303(-)
MGPQRQSGILSVLNVLRVEVVPIKVPRLAVVHVEVLRVGIERRGAVLGLADDLVDAVVGLHVFGQGGGLELLVDLEEVGGEVAGVEGVALDADERDAPLRLPDEDAREEVLALRRDPEVARDLVVDLEDPLHDVLELLVVVDAGALVLRPLKGVLPRQHRVQHHAAGPDVGALPVIVAVCDNLRRNVEVSPDLGLGHGVVLIAL